MVWGQVGDDGRMGGEPAGQFELIGGHFHHGCIIQVTTAAAAATIAVVVDVAVDVFTVASSLPPCFIFL